MDRRQFLKDLAVVTAVTHGLPDGVKRAETAGETSDLPTSSDPRSTLGAAPDIDGHTLISEFKIDATTWKVYEDLRTREGAITYVSSKDGVRVLRKRAVPSPTKMMFAVQAPSMGGRSSALAKATATEYTTQ